MRIGFVTSLLWPRYGHYWTSIASDAGAEVVRAQPEQAEKVMSQRFMRTIPSAAFRAATAEALSLADCDMIIVPHLNHGVHSNRGGGQDPWISDFPAVLASEAGLMNLFPVPARLGPDAEPLAVSLLQQLRHDGWRTRMIMERHRAQLRSAPQPLRDRGRTGTVGVAGQSWLVDTRLAALASGPDRPVLAQSELDPGLLAAEAERTLEGLLPTDLEALGAVRWFARRGSIESIIMLVDEGSSADGWLVRQAGRLSSKEVRPVSVQDLLPDSDLIRHLLTRHDGG